MDYYSLIHLVCKIASDDSINNVHNDKFVPLDFFSATGCWCLAQKTMNLY